MGFVTTAAEIIAFLRSKGFAIETGRGRHGTKAVMEEQRIPIPLHPGDLPPGTARRILNIAGYTISDFLKWRRQ